MEAYTQGSLSREEKTVQQTNEDIWAQAVKRFTSHVL